MNEKVGICKVCEEENLLYIDNKCRNCYYETVMVKGHNIEKRVKKIMNKVYLDLKLPQNIIMVAYKLFRRFRKNGMKGVVTESVAVACIYLACRLNNTPILLWEISESSRISKKEIGRTYRKIKNQLKLTCVQTKPKVCPVDYIIYIPALISKLKLSKKVEIKAKEILEKTREFWQGSGIPPRVIVSAAVYTAALMGDERKTQKEVADVAGCIEVTIKKGYRFLKEKGKLDIPHIEVIKNE